MLKGNNFHHRHKVGVALVPQSVGQATVVGPAITEPWRTGRQVSFILLGGVLGAAVAITAKIEGLKRSDGTTWEALKQNDGTTDLVFPTAKTADAAALENGALLGTVDVSRILGETYSAIRLSLAQATASVTALVGAAYVISDVHEHPTGQVDDLFALTVPA